MESSINSSEESKTGLRIGTAPDSWGVWWPEAPGQIPWKRFLDEVQEVGYHYIELGPYGYLPTEPQRIADELKRRDLALSGGTALTAFHRNDAAQKESRRSALQVAALIAELGAEYLVVLPDFWRTPDKESRIVEPRQLTSEQWHRLTRGHDELGRELYERFGVRQVFHPHADTHVGTYLETERFLENTNPEHTNLCLDVGHFAYYGGDSLQLMECFPERVQYLHLKQVSPLIVSEVLKNDLGFHRAVLDGVMATPPQGIPPYPPILEAMSRIHPDAFAIIERDCLGCEPELPRQVARATNCYIFGSGAPARLR